MLRIGFEAFPTRRQILDVRGICYFSSSTRRQEIFPTPAQLFQPPGELHPPTGDIQDIYGCISLVDTRTSGGHWPDVLLNQRQE